MSASQKYHKILIANRGEIAVRVIRACREMQISPVVVYSQADAQALHVQLADEAYCIGPAEVNQSYLQVDKIMEVAQQAQVQAIHPGYGFLSENVSLVQACQEAGIDFIGPSTEAIEIMGSKIESKRCMDAAGVPTAPGYYGDDQSVATLTQEALKIGFPLLVKASAGGGGKGMRVVRAEKELESAIESAQREALNAFGDKAVFLEKYFENVRHIEAQIIADQHGNYFHLYERDCSIQRRHQKIIEEAPGLHLSPELRQSMMETAVQAAKAVNYTNAGTVEMLLEPAGNFYFLEMNTRLQVEHPVTEMVTGVDLVKAQIRVAQGEKLGFEQGQIKTQGHAVEARIYAEDPDFQFMPTTGTIQVLRQPTGIGVRLDSALFQGMEVTPYYDPMLAKLIAHGSSREEAIARLKTALESFVILGIKTNIPYLLRILKHPAFVKGQMSTAFIQEHGDSLSPQQKELPPAVAMAAVYHFEHAAKAPGSGGSSGSAGDQFNPWLNLGKWPK